jgi:HSP20 family protein
MSQNPKSLVDAKTVWTHSSSSAAKSIAYSAASLMLTAEQAALSGWSNLTPTMDLVENEKDIVISAELPGLDEKDFEVTVAGDLLTLKGEKKTRQEERKGNSTYTERRYGSFSRSVRLPFEVKDEAVEASYDKGELTVRVPKPAGLQPAVRRIEVKRG